MRDSHDRQVAMICAVSSGFPGTTIHHSRPALVRNTSGRSTRTLILVPFVRLDSVALTLTLRSCPMSGAGAAVRAKDFSES